MKPQKSSPVFMFVYLLMLASLACSTSAAAEPTSTYVLVDGELVGEYTLAQSRLIGGYLGLSTLSGTNKDFGTAAKYLICAFGLLNNRNIPRDQT